MLVLTRKASQRIQIGDSICVTILRVRGQAVRIGIEAPDDVRVLRSELLDSEHGESSLGISEPSCIDSSKSTTDHISPVAPASSVPGSSRRREPKAELAATSSTTRSAPLAPMIHRYTGTQLDSNADPHGNGPTMIRRTVRPK